MPANTEIVGHASVMRQLREDLESGNVAHAYLFVGPKRVGKATIARRFAKELLTEGLPPQRAAADATRIDKLIHPDFLALDRLWIEDVCDDWNVIAKSSNVPQDHRAKAPVMRTDTIGIADVRVLQEKLYETGEGKRRCCFIRSIERLQEEAGNALLKLLEEPPTGRVFLLTASSLDAVLPTIVSRTRVLHLNALPEPELMPLLADLDGADARFIMHVAQGAPGMAIMLKRDPDALREHKLMHGQASSFWGEKSAHKRLNLLEPLAERGSEAEAFLLHLALSLRETGTDDRARKTGALVGLVRDLGTNAHRQMILQRFALSLEKTLSSR